MKDILAYVSRAEASTPSAKIALCIVALNIYGESCQGLRPGVRQGKHQRVSTNVSEADVRPIDEECARIARSLWRSGVRLQGARACFEPAVQDRLSSTGFPGYRLSAAQLHEHWVSTGETLVLERWGWRFYASQSHAVSRVKSPQNLESKWQTGHSFFSWLGVS